MIPINFFNQFGSRFSAHFRPKRLIYLFGESQVPQVESENAKTKEAVKNSSAEALKTELLSYKKGL